MNRRLLIEELKRDEGVKLKPYLDSVGKLTIGIGRNIDDRGITIEDAEYLCGNDIDICVQELDRELPWWRGLTETRQRALVNMCFNLGMPKLSTFVRTLNALEDGRWNDAADAALDSRWAAQVGTRAVRIATIFRTG